MTAHREQTERKKTIIFTIGHSTRAIGEFIDLLKIRDIELLADIRTIPASRHNPQFNGEALSQALRENHIEYAHWAGLGGLRRPKQDSRNAGWKNASFRGFADYMQTEGFTRSVGALVESAKDKRTAIMCAEAVPWRCHRSLVADALLVRGIKVMHIMSRTSLKEHVLTAWASREGLALSYPGTPQGKSGP